MEEKSDKRERILDAAQSVFSRKGYHQARVEEIAVLADVGKGTVYEYFSSKLELFQQMFIRVIDRYSKTMSGVFSNNECVTDRIRKMFKFHLQFAIDNREFVLVSFGDIGSVDEELHQWMLSSRNKKVDTLRVIVQEGIDRGEFRNVDPAVVAHMIAGIIQALTIPIILGEKLEQTEVMAESAADVLFRGICI